MLRPLSLYRALLRAHQRHLPAQMRELGDAYVKSEFRLHKSAKPEQAEQFLTEWNRYLEQLLMTARAQEHSRATEGSSIGQERGSLFRFGADLPGDAQLTKEQLAQLEKLKEETSKLPKT